MDAKSWKLFSVTRKEAELITPARPTPREVKQLSDIDDQEGLRFLMPIVFFYRNNPSPSVKGKDPVKVIREALSKALVFYYPVAGRLREGLNKKLMVDCNGEGVLFLEADANVKLEQLGDSIRHPFPYWDEIMYEVPGSRGIICCPLLFIQVTRLTCGGFILALLFNHTIFDGLGLTKFLKTLMEFAKGADSPSLVPVWQREILSARDSPQITCIHLEYMKSINETKAGYPDTEPIVHRSFFFGTKEISAVRNTLPLHLRNCTTFELLAACIWKCRTAALKPDPHTIVRFSSVVNIRGKDNNIQLPPGFYGVAFAFSAICTNVDDLCKNPLGYAVELVKKTKAKVNEEYMKSLADFMVIMGRPTYSTEGNFIISKVSRLGFEEIDFGWGKPLHSGVADAMSIIGYHAKYHNKNGEDGILELLCLPESAMERFEKELKKIIQGSVEDLDKMKMKSTKISSKF